MSSGQQKPSSRVLLDVPSREAFVANLIPLSKPTEKPSAVPKVKENTFRVEPPSELLAKLKNFLPQMAASNELLAQSNPKSYDIENIGEDESQVIEMNLGLGVFEEKKDFSEDVVITENSESDLSDAKRVGIEELPEKNGTPITMTDFLARAGRQNVDEESDDDEDDDEL